MQDVKSSKEGRKYAFFHINIYKAGGIVGIHTNILKNSIDEILEPIIHIIKLPIEKALWRNCTKHNAGKTKQQITDPYFSYQMLVKILKQVHIANYTIWL